uniref:Uncharacterized protein n=1 Tax=Anguilla anguilla TaxID=7936 RepID=A0A0E9UI21_ANGAN
MLSLTPTHSYSPLSYYLSVKHAYNVPANML